MIITTIIFKLSPNVIKKKKQFINYDHSNDHFQVIIDCNLKNINLFTMIINTIICK